jgi:hypothetical protein
VSEPFLERMSKFTPDVGHLERDALLFTAGRASARPNRLWITLASTLAGTQVLSLALLWPGVHPSTDANTLVDQGPSQRSFTSASSIPEASTRDSSDHASLWASRHRLADAELENRSTSGAAGTLVESGPPLRAFSTAPMDSDLTR